MSGRGRGGARAAGAALLATLAAGCGRSGPEQAAPIEIAEVNPAIDSELSTEGDLQAVERAAGVAGVVPGGVPADLPLFAPSSVVDFGEQPDGRAYVEFDTSAEPAAVRRWLGERLPAAGWAIVASGDALEVSKGARRLTLRFEDLAPGTRIRLAYRP